MRYGLIKEVAKEYVIRYTCATMGDWINEVKKEQAEANDWLFTKINELHIQKDEFARAIDELEQEAKTKGTACCYDFDLLTTKFFRK